jgi:hypothetical protein
MSYLKSGIRPGRGSGGNIDHSMDFHSEVLRPGVLVLTRNVNNPEPHYPVSVLRYPCSTVTWRDWSRSP